MSHAPYGDRRRGGVFRFGSAQIKRRGGRRWYWTDTYHAMLAMSWPRFFFISGTLYLATNFLFAALFVLEPNSIDGARSQNLLDAIFFSIETLATVGYGAMHPATLYGHLVASAEILTGMAEVAFMTGLLFARFSRPTARFLFSKVAVVARFNGMPALMVRVGNERNNLIIEATVKASIVRRERTLEGQEFTRFYDLPLERDTTSVFALSWTVMHVIDERSPLYGRAPEAILDDSESLIVTMTGMDDTLNDFVHDRHSYAADEVLYGRRFADILSEREGDVRIINFDLFHDTVPDAAAATS
ncbi:ATP-sensitive inward rectifier potassium channel 10 [Massilia arenosa]|uniref:ATP-sensitive inward rectifier potassium channel 10 n=2 Tax=Zemynaea arenosa TaxID=2561931 RepID=A0A4Y9SGP1_9BURK|nr:ATP-sensitive inward rectifier potassium channel 10 [Massilia arenosa]